MKDKYYHILAYLFEFLELDEIYRMIAVCKAFEKIVKETVYHGSKFELFVWPRICIVRYMRHYWIDDRPRKKSELEFAHFPAQVHPNQVQRTQVVEKQITLKIKSAKHISINFIEKIMCGYPINTSFVESVYFYNAQWPENIQLFKNVSTIVMDSFSTEYERFGDQIKKLIVLNFRENSPQINVDELRINNLLIENLAGLCVKKLDCSFAYVSSRVVRKIKMYKWPETIRELTIELPKERFFPDIVDNESDLTFIDVLFKRFDVVSFRTAEIYPFEYMHHIYATFYIKDLKVSVKKSSDPAVKKVVSDYIWKNYNQYRNCLHF